MKKLFLVILLLLSVISELLAAEPEYNVDSKILSIPSIDVESPNFLGPGLGIPRIYDATLELNRLGSFDILNYSIDEPSGSFEIEANYDPFSGVLRIPSVKIGNGSIYNAVLRLDQSGKFSILDYLNETPIDCTKEMLTLDKFKQLSPEKNLEQVTDIIGCTGKLEFDLSVSKYSWRQGNGFKPSIDIHFRNGGIISWIFTDPNGDKVKCFDNPLVNKQPELCF
ncbi:MAG: hypothetical protein V3U75_03470 [Methylococcaceae bacterium]